jgi:hypothetical protein
MNNPPAFPIANLWHNELKQYNGMTLRDYFAAKAMQGLCAKGNFPTGIMFDTAKEAYQIADEMLKAREA